MFENKVEILNISVGGVLLKTDKRLNIRTIYMLRLEGQGNLITVLLPKKWYGQRELQNILWLNNLPQQALF